MFVHLRVYLPVYRTSNQPRMMPQRGELFGKSYSVYVIILLIMLLTNTASVRSIILIKLLLKLIERTSDVENLLLLLSLQFALSFMLLLDLFAFLFSFYYVHRVVRALSSLRCAALGTLFNLSSYHFFFSYLNTYLPLPRACFYDIFATAWSTTLRGLDLRIEIKNEMRVEKERCPDVART